jgi:hypothetical protein
MLLSVIREYTMAEPTTSRGAELDVIAPDGTRQLVVVDKSPFFIGRGGGTNN